MSNGDVKNATSLPILAKDATLRDMFAGQALVNYSDFETGGTLEEAAKVLGVPAQEYSYEIHFPIIVARRCYQIADAMLAEREKAK